MSLSKETMDLLTKALNGGESGGLHKAITQNTGLINFDLQAPAKNLYPTITLLGKSLPRVPGKGGIATNWRAVTAITGGSKMPWTPEGKRGARISYTTANKSAPYVTLSAEDNITEEALNAGKGFEELMSTMSMRLLQQGLMEEEYAILGGNATLALGTVGTVTTSASGTGATLPALTYDVACVALTLEGYLAASLTAAGCIQAQTVNSADGSTYVLNGGSSMKSAVATQAITLGQHLFASVVPVVGAVAYAWYIGASGAAKLEAITTLPSLEFTTALAGTNQALTAITADCSLNATLAFDGLLSTALKGGSGAYVKTMAAGVAGTGTPLTAGGRRNVTEIDVMLKSMWDNYRVSPTVIYCNSQELNNITNKVMNSNTSPIFAANQKDPYAVVANGVVSGYYNPFTLFGTPVIPIVLHPNMPAGTILAYCENLPLQYQSNEVPNVAEMHVRSDWRQTFWQQITRTRDTGIYVEEGLAVYAPFAMGVINNIGNG